jgi:hypothetical protein
VVERKLLINIRLKINLFSAEALVGALVCATVQALQVPIPTSAAEVK